MMKLSTPHGALGTSVLFATKHYRNLYLSTPHGALGTAMRTEEMIKLLELFQLHTVH